MWILPGLFRGSVWESLCGAGPIAILKQDFLAQSLWSPQPGSVAFNLEPFELFPAQTETEPNRVTLIGMIVCDGLSSSG